MLALDADTGKLKWHYQYTPHDLHDYDATQIPILVDRPWNGPPRKLLVHANRNGFLYVLDRSNGELLSAKPFANLTWATEIGKDGRPVEAPGAKPTLEGTRVCPGALGATNWFSPSYSPKTGLLYVSTSEECDVFAAAPQKYHAGHDFLGSVYVPAKGEKSRGAIEAIDPFTGEKKWKFQYTSPPNGGVLSTAGGIVFAGNSEGNFISFDAVSGRPLWHMQLGAAIYSSPITFAVDGKQYVVIPAGGALFAFALSKPGGADGRAQP
jgi:alcohol dehydrogenase (cytochrome c)